MVQLNGKSPSSICLCPDRYHSPYIVILTFDLLTWISEAFAVHPFTKTNNIPGWDCCNAIAHVFTFVSCNYCPKSFFANY